MKSIILLFTLAAILLIPLACVRQNQTKDFILTDAPLIALTHLRLIDGTGAQAKDNQTILIEAGQIKAIGDTSAITIPSTAKVFDLSGHTAIPGLIGMHEHLFYTSPAAGRDVSAAKTFPRLYLASGVTTIRTAGAINLADDVAARDSIENGDEPGPTIFLSSPYLNRPVGQTLDSSQIETAINEWANQGVTSIKVYTNISRAELATAIEVAHKRGLRVTGHLCAVGFGEAAGLEIDNLEHGLLVDTEFYSGKKPDVCPAQNLVLPELAELDVKSDVVQSLIKELVDKRVAITSTLAIFETFTGNRFEPDARMEKVLTPAAHQEFLSRIKKERGDQRWAVWWQLLLKKEMEFEREFVRHGGTLLAGVDPTGWGGIVAGFGDQRQLELLVEAGFSVEEAVQIYTSNAAQFLGEDKRVGTLAEGKQGDIVILQGELTRNVAAIRDVKIVFKKGIAYNPSKLMASIAGRVG